VRLVAAIAGLINSGKRCLFVSSGSVGSGFSAFGLTKYPEDIVTRQACAGVGQARLMETYGALFSNFDITVAQVLLTATDLATPEKAGYVSSKLERILEEPRGCPSSTRTIPWRSKELTFGNNDMLSLTVCQDGGGFKDYFAD